MGLVATRVVVGTEAEPDAMTSGALNAVLTPNEPCSVNDCAAPMLAFNFDFNCFNFEVEGFGLVGLDWDCFVGDEADESVESDIWWVTTLILRWRCGDNSVVWDLVRSKPTTGVVCICLKLVPQASISLIVN